MNRVFVIVVTYNGMHWIKACIDSLLASTIKVSIVIVDNNSTDNTVAFVKEHYKEAPIFMVASNKNLGFGLANNMGIKHALKNNADFLFLLNQDAFVEKDTIENLVDLASKNKDYGIISPIHTNGDGTLLDDSFLYYTRRNTGKAFISDFVINKGKEPIYSLPMINAAAWLLPTSTIEMVGGFDPMFFLYGEDDNYCQRVNYHNLKIGIASEVFIRHDSQNNNSKETPVGSEAYYALFLNRIKVRYANVNNDSYKELGKLKAHFFKRCIISLLGLNYQAFKVNLEKRKLLSQLDLKSSVLLNRQQGRKYL